MNKQEVMITPNQLELATKELSKVDLGNYKIPTEIQEAEKDYYVIIGINAQLVGIKVVTEARTVFYDKRAWARMKKDLDSKNPMFKIIGANQFKEVILLHNPTMPLAIEASKAIETDGSVKGELFTTTGRLTDTKKETINKLMEERGDMNDQDLNEISKEVNAPFAKVKEYIKSF